MGTPTLDLNVLDCLSRLSCLPFIATDKVDAFTRLVHLTHRALGSHACSLGLVDLEERTLTVAACRGPNEEFENRMIGRVAHLGNPGDGRPLDYNTVMRGHLIQCFRLTESGQGLVNTHTAQRYQLESQLAFPIRQKGRLLGYLAHFSKTNPPGGRFSKPELFLISSFARIAAVIIERFDYQREFKQSWETLNLLTPQLEESWSDFLARVCGAACNLLNAPVGLVWRCDPKHPVLRIAAAMDAVDAPFRELELPVDLVRQRKRLSWLRDISKSQAGFHHLKEVKVRGWKGLLSAQMWAGGDLLGMIEVYTRSPRWFLDWEKQLLVALANHVALSIQRADDLVRRERLHRLNKVAEDLANTRNMETLLEQLFVRAAELVPFKRGWISQLDPATGDLGIVKAVGNPVTFPALKLGQGISGHALKEEKPIRVNDVRDPQWGEIYREFWPDTQSELAVPLLVDKTPYREGRETKSATRLIGVLNIESSDLAAFSAADEELLWALARHVAILFERFECDRKTRDLQKIEKELVGRKDWDGIIQDVLTAIPKTLGYDFVNISLVVPEEHVIRTDHVIGFSDAEVAEFKKLASHPLDSNDIQAHVYRHGEIEVPLPEDPRYDPVIYQRFGQKDWVRVFVPMMSSDNRVIGTVETGYTRGPVRPRIYELDLQVLQDLVNFAGRALEGRRRGLLDKFGHEFRQPIVGIRNNASFVLRHLDTLDDGKIRRKLEDTLLDCEMLLQQVGELEYVLGRPAPAQRKEWIYVLRDVIIKTIHQLSSLIVAEGFDPRQVRLGMTDVRSLYLYLDRAKLNQIVYNLLNNSIKYAEKDPKKFFITIDVVPSRDYFTLRFRDWGIGIREGLEEKIFANAYRAPEAISKNVSGLGLGLTIARAAARELGGDLLLFRRRDPTEFHLKLPKTLSQGPVDEQDPHDRR